MNANSARPAAGCLCIGEIPSGASDASGPFRFIEESGLRIRAFDWRAGEAPWERLQAELFRLRRSCGGVVMAALGTGCAAALALAAQLPVERAALIDPVLTPPREEACIDPALRRQLRRIAGFARRNLSLCAADMLVVEHGPGTGASLAGRLSPRCRVARLQIQGKSDKEMYKIHEQAAKSAISSFLHSGDLPKSLAENPEMCIIYG